MRSGTFQTVDRVELAYWVTPGDVEPGFLLVHGLASNARLWDGVADRLGKAGHPTLAVDLRGHGQSDKPAAGYNFATMAADLAGLVADQMSLPVVVAGQSFGGHLAMEMADRYPRLVRGIVCLDGGFFHLSSSFPSWESALAALTPPSLDGLTRESVMVVASALYPGWPPEGLTAQGANLEELQDGSLRRRLPLAAHLTLIRAMFDQDPIRLANRLSQPVLIIAAEGEGAPDKPERVEAFTAALARGRLFWMKGHHDLHGEKPQAVAEFILNAVANGYFT